MRAYSNDLREKILKALNNGQKAKDVAARFDVGINWVYKIRRRFSDTGNYEALPRSGRPHKLKEEDMQKISALINANPSLTLDKLKEEGNFNASRITIYRALKKLKITCKKTLFVAEQNRYDVKQKRIDWIEKYKNWDINTLIFLDESSIKTSMVSLYGWGLKDKRIKDYIPDARWKSLSILSSLRIDGTTEAIVYKG